MEEDKDHKTCRVKLGLIGREGDDIKEEPTINRDIASYIPMLTQLLEAGKLRPNESKVTSTGFEGIAQAIDIQQKGANGGVKVVVKCSLNNSSCFVWHIMKGIRLPLRGASAIRRPSEHILYFSDRRSRNQVLL